MRFHLSVVLFIALCVFTVVPQSNASYIIDTGEPSSAIGNPVMRNPHTFQYLAGKFVIEDGYSALITGIYGYMTGLHRQESFEGVNDLTIAVYGSELYQHPYPYVMFERPDRDNEYYSTTFIGPYDERPDSQDVRYYDLPYQPGWYGLDSLSWTLGPGEYWVALEVRPGQDFEATLGNDAPYPMEKYAFYVDGNPDYHLDRQNQHWGFRIEGDLASTAVPVPAAVWLLASGLLGLLGFRKKF